jgi:hypothetical protein
VHRMKLLLQRIIGLAFGGGTTVFARGAN